MARVLPDLQHGGYCVPTASVSAWKPHALPNLLPEKANCHKIQAAVVPQ